ncbi:AraC family transcriptional regulator [Halobacillus sp. Cin3]|uniref:helix-turn-helix domain-containing protein n=1 Tax=Halobacillus sp. Cin3 TaxID=2928441 RepID=UPI00248EEC85|nr:AraC family transcriptional regulator [Halobacillus sp. Cin3]
MIWQQTNGLFLQRFDQLGERSWREDFSYKLIFSPAGKGRYQTKFGDMSIEEGAFLLMNPTAPHKQLHAFQEKFLVELHPFFIQEAAAELSIHAPVEFAEVSYKHPLFLQWLSFVRGYLTDHQDQSSDLLLDHALTQLAVLMVEYGAGSHQVDLPVSRYSDPIRQLMAVLKEGYTTAWTLDDMAVAAQVNKYQLAHWFKRETGLAPYSWLQLYRLIRSQPDLLYTTESILTLALKHGFSSVSSYHALFKKMYGKTPTQLRRSYQHP